MTPEMRPRMIQLTSMSSSGVMKANVICMAKSCGLGQPQEIKLPDEQKRVHLTFHVVQFHDWNGLHRRNRLALITGGILEVVYWQLVCRIPDTYCRIGVSQNARSKSPYFGSPET